MTECVLCEQTGRSKKDMNGYESEKSGGSLCRVKLQS